jgi:hypothetical protein
MRVLCDMDDMTPMSEAEVMEVFRLLDISKENERSRLKILTKQPKPVTQDTYIGNGTVMETDAKDYPNAQLE